MADPCPNAANHTDGPPGYVAWFEWAEEMAKTHVQSRCPGCGLFKIWTLRRRPLMSELPEKEPRVGRWPCYMGRFSVPPWLFNAAPLWMHEAADWLGGVEPSPWRDLRMEIGDGVKIFFRRLFRRDRA